MGLKITKNTIPKGLQRERDVLAREGEKMLRVGARVVRIQAALNAPIDTSRYVNSLRAEDGKQVVNFKAESRLGRENTPQESDVINEYSLFRHRYELRFGSGVPYAAALEFGTSRTRPQPSLGPALSAKGRDALSAMATILKKGLK